MPTQNAAPFDLGVLIVPNFAARESTIWPAVNTLDEKVDALINAEDALIARLKQRDSQS